MSYYSILGVSFQATPREITTAYRRAASRFHPDKSKAPDSTQHFQMIGEAYQVLHNKESRRNYDLSIGLKSPNFNSEYTTQYGRNSYVGQSNSDNKKPTSKAEQMVEQMWNQWGKQYIFSYIESMCDQWLENVNKTQYK